MISELSGFMAKSFHVQLEAAEAMCFTTHESNNFHSVLIVDSAFTSESKVEYLKHGEHSFEVLSIRDLRLIYQLDVIEIFAAFLQHCVVLKDEYQDLFDVKRTLDTIVFSELRGIGSQQEQRSSAIENLLSVPPKKHAGYFSSFFENDPPDAESPVGYKILCTGLPQIHRFIKRQCFGLLEELQDVTRSLEFAFWRSSRQPRSIFSIELFGIDQLNKAELEKRLSLFCAQRNRYPGPVNFRLFKSKFGNETRALFTAAVSRRILTEFYPKSTGPQGFTNTITPHVLTLLLTILKLEDIGTARTTIDDLVNDQLQRILTYKEFPGEITNQEKIAYQLDLQTDTMVITQKAGIMAQMGRGLKFRNKAIYEDEIFQAFEQWKEKTRPSANEATGLLFDSFCISPYRSYYFLRTIQVLLNDKV